MTKWLLTLFIALCGTSLVATDAEARRFGGARSLGAQRAITPPPARPAPQKQADAAKQASPAAQGSRWAPIFGGLALGGLLGWLFAGNGLGGLVLVALIVFGVMLLLRAVQRRAQAPGAVQFAGMRERVVLPPSGSGGAPTDFDAPGFLRAAKRSFLRLQVANDAGDLEAIRDLVTDEMLEALKAEVPPRGGEQQTEIIGLEARLLELATERNAHWASVHFSGLAREAAGANAEPFEEVWNLVKPVDGSSGWLLAGIQQMH